MKSRPLIGIISFLTNLLDDAKLYEYLLQSLYATLNLLLGVVGHKGKAHEGVLGSTCGWNNGVDKHATLVSLCCYDEGLLNIVNIQGNDGALGLTNLETFLTETLQGILSNIPQLFNALGLLLQYVQCLKSSSGSSRCVLCTEDVGAAGVTQIVDGVGIASDEATD